MATTATARAVADLAACVRSGVPLRVAIEQWPVHVPPGELSASLVAVARRTRLGLAPPYALDPLRTELGMHADSLVTIVQVHTRLGGDVATSLECLASVIDLHAQEGEASRATAAAALASGRVLAVLPVLAFPMMPAAGAKVTDLFGLVLVVSGTLLCWLGLRWIRRLIPRPPADDDVAALAEVVAALGRGGIGIAAALDAVGGEDERASAGPMVAAARRVALGMSWPAALTVSEDPRLRALGGVVARSIRLGLPAHDALHQLARNLRLARRNAFEVNLRKAPVRMVVPLVTCFLPAFILLALAPFLRALPLP